MIRFGARRLFPCLHGSFGKAAINLKELRQESSGNKGLEPVEVTRKVAAPRRTGPRRESMGGRETQKVEGDLAEGAEAREHYVLAHEARKGFFKGKSRYGKANKEVGSREGMQEIGKEEGETKEKEEMTSVSAERQSRSVEPSDQRRSARAMYRRGRSSGTDREQTGDSMKWIEEEAKRDKGFEARIRGKSTIDDLFYYLGKLKGAKSTHQCAGLARIIALTKMEKRRYTVQKKIGNSQGPEDKKFIGNKVQFIWQDARMIKLTERISSQIQHLNSESVLVLLRAVNSSESLSDARNRLMCTLFKYVPLDDLASRRPHRVDDGQGPVPRAIPQGSHQGGGPCSVA
jgi:hypothetical protein